MVNSDIVADVIRNTLDSFILAPEYADEQRDLQSHIQKELENSFHASFPGEGLVTTISIGGKGKPHLKLHGTSFWPDVEVTSGDTRFSAVEVKLIRPGQPASSAIVETIGQAMIYSIRYPRVFAFILHLGRSDNRLHDEDDELRQRLALVNIELILRRA